MRSIIKSLGKSILTDPRSSFHSSAPAGSVYAYHNKFAHVAHVEHLGLYSDHRILVHHVNTLCIEIFHATNNNSDLRKAYTDKKLAARVEEAAVQYTISS